MTTPRRRRQNGVTSCPRCETAERIEGRAYCGDCTTTVTREKWIRDRDRLRAIRQKYAPQTGKEAAP